ncbi:MAG: hypothetical protein ABI549_11750 [Flavobacterium sp.]|uniref:hypothetical protein n=1 Tax=Flavobacterium sp. TaxID=239 RepID=UPI0032679B9C
MSDEKEKYFNFPIHLLQGFIKDSYKCLNDITDFAIYERSIELAFGDELERMKSAAKFYDLKLSNYDNSLKNGIRIYNETVGERLPKTGLSLSLFWEYYKNDKTEFDKVCLLAFLALRSIIQNKAYTKVDNKYLLSRMDGKARSFDLSELSEELLKYSSRRLLEKVKKELQFNWYLIYYSRYTRGFYISFKLSLEDLIFEAEKRRVSTKEKEQKQIRDEALRKALCRLTIKPP